MPKIVVTAEVEDHAKWEQGFRTHADLFRSQTIKQPIEFALVDGNQVVIMFEPENLGTYMEILEGPDTAAAMAFDGVKRETVKLTVLDRKFEL